MDVCVIFLVGGDMPSMVYNYAKQAFVDGTLDWDNPAQNFSVLLVNPTYSPSQSHLHVSDIASYEVSGTGYSRKPLSNRTVTIDTAANRAILSADPVTWTAINAGNVGGIVVYYDTGSDSTSKLIAFVQLPTISTNGSDLTIAWPGGVLYVQ